MRTICINPECQRIYDNIKAEQIGKIARCKRCNTVFTVEEYIESDSNLIFALSDEESEEENNSQDVGSVDQESSQKRRRSSQEIIQDTIKGIKIAAKRTIPLMMQLYDRDANETETRHGIEVILRDLLGYDLVEEVRKEVAARGLKADYIIELKGGPKIVIEAKRIGLNLNKKHIYQAANYGKLTGIEWVVLTNGLVWELYRVDSDFEYYQIFNIDLLDGLSDAEAEYFYLISKDCMNRKNFLENHWRKILALSPYNLNNIILSDEVIAKIRTVLTRETGYRATEDELREALEQTLVDLD